MPCPDFGGVAQTPTVLTAWTAGVSGQQLSETSAWTLDASWTTGSRDLGSARGYEVLRANAGWRGRLSSRSQVVVRGGLQHSSTDLLPSAEEFQLGGSASVRGYPEGLLSGRQGFLASMEWHYALQAPQDTSDASAAPNASQWTGILFLDHGAAFPYRPAPLSGHTHDDYLTGAGLGVIAQWGRHVTGRLTVAWPLQDNPALSTQKQARWMASLTYTWP